MLQFRCIARLEAFDAFLVRSDLQPTVSAAAFSDSLVDQSLENLCLQVDCFTRFKSCDYVVTRGDRSVIVCVFDSLDCGVDRLLSRVSILGGEFAELRSVGLCTFDSC